MFVFLSEKSQPEDVAKDIFDLRKHLAQAQPSVAGVEGKNRELATFLQGFDGLVEVVRAQLASQEALDGFGYKPLLDVRELPDTRIFITFPLLTEHERRGVEKCDVAAACFGFNSLSLKEGKVDAQIVVEDNKTTHYLNVTGVGQADVLNLILGFATMLKKRKQGQDTELLEFVLKIAQSLDAQQHEFQYSKEKLPKYSPYNVDAKPNEDNLKDLVWLEATFGAGTPVDQGNERLVKAKIGARTFELLESEGMTFVLDNRPTLDVLDAAIDAGLLPPERRHGFVTVEEEQEVVEKTKQQYVDSGNVTGQSKDLRDKWRNAVPRYDYDPVRGLYYLSIESEPVMDEFERTYISLLGKNAARLGGAVLEIGFGMGISSNAIQRELRKHHDPGAGRHAVHILIELNRHVAEIAREWGSRQEVPVIVLEGDWREQIHRIPDGILTGSLSDPYPLNPDEKHKDAALALGEIHQRLRPGGLSVHYSDSQYCLHPDHEAIARDAGFELLGSMTSSFGAHLNTGEYYSEGLRMVVPALYKAGGTRSHEWIEREVGPEDVEDLMYGLFEERP